MKITNDLNLPMPLVKAIEADPYDNLGSLSVTTLLRPPQAVALARKHAAEITEDASDRVWALLGQIGHGIIERAAGSMDQEEWDTEKRYHANLFDENISGQADLVHKPSGTVYDFKFTSGWAVMNAMKEGKNEWRIQLSLLALLARANGLTINRGKIIAIVRDWTPRVATRNRDWPQKGVVSLDMDIMSHADTLEWLGCAVRGLQEALAGNPRPCTDEERWCKPGKWAVYKGSNVKAAKLADSEDDLSGWIGLNQSKLGPTYRIEQRPTVFTRCDAYCNAAQYCSQYKNDRGGGDETAGE